MTEAASAAWSRVTRSATATWDGLQARAQRAGVLIKAPFEGLTTTASSGFGRVAQAADVLWQALAQGLAGGRSVLDWLKALAGGVVDALATPLQRARDGIAGVWSVLRTGFFDVGRSLQSVRAAMLNGFQDRALVSTLTDVFAAVRSFLSGDTTFFEAGRRILVALGKGIRSAVTYPFELLRQALARLRALLPFSDAATGPLSNLTVSGAAILQTLAQGMTGALGAALVALTAPFQGMAEAATEAWSRGARAGTAAWEGLQARAQRAGAWVTAPFEALAAAARSAANTIAQVAGGLGQALAQGFAQGFAGDRVVLGLKIIGGAVEGFLATPFQRVREGIASISGVLPGALSAVGRFAQAAADSLVGVFRDGSLVQTVRNLVGAVGRFLTGAPFFEAGRHLFVSLGQGIRSVASYPFEVTKEALARLGGLPDLTASGSAILQTFAQGMTGVLGAPRVALSRAFVRLLATAAQGWQGLQSLATSAVGAVIAPFGRIAEAASAAWSRAATMTAGAWIDLQSTAQRSGAGMRVPFEGLAAGVASAMARTGRAAQARWRALAGDRWVLDGLRSIQGAVVDLLATPFLRAREGIASVWGVLPGLFSTFGGIVQSTAATLVGVFRDLPLVRTLQEAFSAARDFLFSDTAFFQAGRRFLESLGQGIAAASSYPLESLKQALGKLRSLLPFSDAETGPLSNLTASGAAILQTLAQGMAGVLALPATVLD